MVKCSGITLITGNKYVRSCKQVVLSPCKGLFKHCYLTYRESVSDMQIYRKITSIPIQVSSPSLVSPLGLSVFQGVPESSGESCPLLSSCLSTHTHIEALMLTLSSVVRPCVLAVQGGMNCPVKL